MLAYFQNSFTVRLDIKFAVKDPCYISHRTLSMSLDYLEKYKRSKIAQI